MERGEGMSASLPHPDDSGVTQIALYLDTALGQSTGAKGIDEAS